MNLHAVRGGPPPAVVLYQFDSHDPMNPLGLLVAYAEASVKPVVSDFDTFTIGSRGMQYEKLPADQVELMKWSLSHTQSILENKGNKSWTSRWLEVLKVEQEKGFHPEFPKFGFGDPTSVSIIADCVSVVAPCGAVRHGAECFNFFFPQELDDEYLVIWQGFPDIPWKSHTEPELRKFLLDRLEEGFNFPMNPVWPVRDQGWYDVFTKQRSSEQGKKIMTSWIPSDMAAKIEEMYASNPDGFVKQGVARRGSVLTGALDLGGCEKAELAEAELAKEQRMREREKKLKITGKWRIFSNALAKREAEALTNVARGKR